MEQVQCGTHLWVLLLMLEVEQQRLTAQQLMEQVPESPPVSQLFLKNYRKCDSFKLCR